ncbi:hypothetical protein FK268_09095 [Tsukamurella sputi]|uniref:Uncharacterized protein n=1 Tax=Tsukamurella sputi TaxID=2591848 RepID=A0A5C5RQI3_9ACTN|nr:hypothetical protein [Tsukamurella sputi]TWS25339.1 hypothetical protein FK268_09095 [Tsukamurella sputi]
MAEHRAPETPQPLAWLTPARRRWLYGVLVLLAPILVLRGFVSREEADLWVDLLGAALVGGSGLVAIAHVPKD